MPHAPFGSGDVRFEWFPVRARRDEEACCEPAHTLTDIHAAVCQFSADQFQEQWLFDIEKGRLEENPCASELLF